MRSEKPVHKTFVRRPRRPWVRDGISKAEDGESGKEKISLFSCETYSTTESYLKHWFQWFEDLKSSEYSFPQTTIRETGKWKHRIAQILGGIVRSSQRKDSKLGKLDYEYSTFLSDLFKLMFQFIICKLCSFEFAVKHTIPSFGS